MRCNCSSTECLWANKRIVFEKDNTGLPGKLFSLRTARRQNTMSPAELPLAWLNTIGDLNLQLLLFLRKVQYCCSIWTGFFTMLPPQFSPASVLVVRSSNPLFTGNVDVSCQNLTTPCHGCQQVEPILSATRNVALGPSIAAKKNKLKAQNTLYKVANRSKAAIIDEPINGPSTQTVVQRPIGSKSKDRKRSKKSHPIITIQLVASSTATSHSLDQTIDSTSDEVDPAQPTGRRNFRSARIKHIEQNPLPR